VHTVFVLRVMVYLHLAIQISEIIRTCVNSPKRQLIYLLLLGLLPAT